MAAPQNGPVEITRTVADLGGMTAPRYEEMTGEELAQTVADLSGMSLEEVKTDGVQTSLVALLSRLMECKLHWLHCTCLVECLRIARI